MFDQMCLEEKILYNIISGLHTSISTHLSRFYKHSDTQSAWADLRASIEDNKFHFNHSEYKKRVLDHPDRIKNLMFLYRVLGKAITTASPYLRHNFTVQSDKINEDILAQSYLVDLLKELDDFDFSAEEKETLSFFTPDNPHVR
jgi:ERO1-like protein alpha